MCERVHAKEIRLFPKKRRSMKQRYLIIIFIEETFSRTCGFRKGPQRLMLKMLKIKRTKNKKLIKHLN